MSDLPQAQADPHLEAAIDDALEAYHEALPTSLLVGMAELLREELARHPVSARLLRQLAPAPVVARSADVQRGDTGSEAESAGVPGDRTHRRSRR